MNNEKEHNAARRLSQFRQWVAATGALPRGSSWIGELEAIVVGRGEDDTAPTASDAGTIDTINTSDFCELVAACRPYGQEGVQAHKRLVAHIDQHVAAAVAEVANERDGALADRDRWESAYNAAVSDVFAGDIDQRITDAVIAHDEKYAALLPGVWYMDHPDGGDVSVLEQFRRMAADAAKWREHEAKLRSTAGVGGELDPLRYATELARGMWAQHYMTDAPEWEPFPDLYGVLSQIDNMLTGLARAVTAPVSAAPTPEAIVAAVHAASATGRVALTVTGADGIERPTNVAECFVRRLLAPSAGAPVSAAEQAQPQESLADRLVKHGLATRKPVSAPADGQELPALPKHLGAIEYYDEQEKGIRWTVGYSAEQAREYARAALAMRQPQGVTLTKKFAADVLGALFWRDKINPHGYERIKQEFAAIMRGESIADTAAKQAGKEAK